MADLRDDAERVLASLPASVILPAGCGKTELIAVASAIAQDQGRRVLVLTHTNAGVEVLRRRLKCRGVMASSAAVRTIDSWCEYLCKYFPTLADVDVSSSNRYAANCSGAVRVLNNQHFRRSLLLSHDYLFVDEYQDTSDSQHAVVMAMREELPTAVIGDPLQGIYEWRGNLIIDWQKDVAPAFPLVDIDIEPWRWRSHNEALGQWLLEIRQPLLNGEKVRLGGLPFLTWRQKSPVAQRGEGFSALDDVGHVVAIHGQPAQCHAYARQLGGRYGVMEELDCRILKKVATAVDSGSGPATAAALLWFARECAIGFVKPLDGAQVTALSNGIRPRARAGTKAGAAISALADVSSNADPQRVATALKQLSLVEGTKIFRREAWYEAERASSLWIRSPGATFTECAENIRNRTRIIGRLAERRTVSRTLLVKGLEYDTCIVLDADSLSSRNLYVALTRARKRLVVLSQLPYVIPSQF